MKEAKVVEDHPQWDLSDTEDEANNQNDDASNDSDYSTDDDDEYDDWNVDRSWLWNFKMSLAFIKLW